MADESEFRKLLSRIVAVFCLVAALALAFVFSAGLLPTETTTAKNGRLEVPLSEIPKGSYKLFRWSTTPVVVVRPDRSIIEELASLNSAVWGAKVQPDAKPIAFAYIPLSPIGGCLVDPIEKIDSDPDLPRGWWDPCHVGAWDLAGRSLKYINSGKREYKGLQQINFSVVSEQAIELYR